jgi:LPS export ABC transporter protein LptC
MLTQARFRIFRLSISWPQLGLLLSLCLVAGSSAYLALKLASRHEPQPTMLGRGQADYYATAVHMLRYNHQGLVSMQLLADRLDHVPDRQQLRLIQPKIWLSAGASNTQISALDGIASDDGEKASLSGSVVVVRKTDDSTSLQIRSERALIDAAKQRVEMPDEVRIERGEHWVSGKQLVLDQAEKQLRLGAGVQAFFPSRQIEQAEPIMTARSKP